MKPAFILRRRASYLRPSARLSKVCTLSAPQCMQAAALPGSAAPQERQRYDFFALNLLALLNLVTSPPPAAASPPCTGRGCAGVRASGRVGLLRPTSAIAPKKPP